MSAFIRISKAPVHWQPLARTPFGVQSRTISQTRAAQKALSFSLNTTGTSSSVNGESKILRMLIFGKPGAGKGTLSARLVKKYEILSLSTGDLLRQHITERYVVYSPRIELLSHLLSSIKDGGGADGGRDCCYRRPAPR